MNIIEIPLSKKKALRVLIYSILFIAMALLMFVSTTGKQSFDAYLLKAFSIFAMLFFGYGGIKMRKIIIDKRPGLILDEHGIQCNPTVINAGLIQWKNITEIKRQQVLSVDFLLIFVDNQTEILERMDDISRKFAEQNVKTYGTAIAIADTVLDYALADLEKILTENWEKRQQ